MKFNQQKFLNLLAVTTIALACFLLTPKPFLPQTATQKGLPPAGQIVNQEKRPAAALVSLEIDPVSKIVKTNDLFEIQIVIDALTHQVVATDLWLSYDPSLFSLSEIRPGGFFSDPKILGKKVDPSLGKIAYGIGSLSPCSGKGTLAVLVFKVLASPAEAKEAEISLDENTLVAALDEGKIQPKFSQAGRYLIAK